MKIKIVCLIFAVATILSGCNDFNDNTKNNSDMLKNPLDIELTSPPIDEDNSSVDLKYQYRYIDTISDEIPKEFQEIVGENKYALWVQEFAGKDPQGTRTIEDYNLISFIIDFNISKQQFMEANNKIKSNPNNSEKGFTQQEIEILYSNETALINKTFVNDEAILYGNEIYTLSWFASNSVDEYKRVGFPVELLKEKCNQWGESTEFSVYTSGVQLVFDNILVYEQQLESAHIVEAEDFLFTAEYCWDFYNIPEDFAKLVPDENAFEEWSNNFKAINFNGQYEAKEYTILNFIESFYISKEDFIEINNQYYQKGSFLFNNLEIDALFSGDMDEINRMFINQQSIIWNGIIYTPEWFAENDAKAYRDTGIPVDILRNKYIQWENDKTFINHKDGINGINDKITTLEVLKP